MVQKKVEGAAPPPPKVNDPEQAPPPDTKKLDEAARKRDEEDRKRLAEKQAEQERLQAEQREQALRKQAVTLVKGNDAADPDDIRSYDYEGVIEARRKLSDVIQGTSDYSKIGKAKLEFLFKHAYPSGTPLEHPIFGYAGVVVTFGDLVALFGDDDRVKK